MNTAMYSNIDALIGRLRENCTWYFGHNVRIVTFYKGSVGWCAMVVRAESTMKSTYGSVEGGDIHLYGESKRSLYKAVEGVQSQIERRIGDIFQIESDRFPTIPEYQPTCNCLSVPSARAPETEVQDPSTIICREDGENFETTEIATSESLSGHDPPTPPIPFNPIVSTLASFLTAAKATEAHCPVSGVDTEQQPPSPSSTSAQTFEEQKEETIFTPSASGTERSVTPRADPGKVSEIDRNIIRQEVSDALAVALANLARMFGNGGNDSKGTDGEVI